MEIRRAHICRFTGHTREFYSVAQHSVMVSCTVPPELALEGLMHDAAEAFIGDVSRPLKALLPDYKAIEKRIEAAVLRRFGIHPDLPEEVKKADMVLLATEKRDLMACPHDHWETLSGVQPLAFRLVPMAPAMARAMFLARFRELTTQGGA